MVVGCGSARRSWLRGQKVSGGRGFVDRRSWLRGGSPAVMASWTEGRGFVASWRLRVSGGSSGRRFQWAFHLGLSREGERREKREERERAGRERGEKKKLFLLIKI